MIIASFWGSSRQLGTGPVAVVSLMTAAALGPIVANMGLPSEELVAAFVGLAALLALLIGVFQFSLGMFRLGVIVDFLSHPVVTGFTNGAAIIIATSQLNKIFGVERPDAEHSYEQVWGVLVNAADHTHFTTLAMGIFALLIMILIKNIGQRYPMYSPL